MKKQWYILSPDKKNVHQLVERLRCHPATAKVLTNRGYTIRTAKSFLYPSFSGMRSPFTLKDLDKAVQRIHRAVTDGEAILVIGDYDVDGTTATTILIDFLTAAGARVSWYIPHRQKEGYGLRPRHVLETATERNATLIITVDNGITSHDAALAARKSGIDLIITDHHTPPPTLPDAYAVINPKRADCPSGLEKLAGVGVAYCLIIGLRRHLRHVKFSWPGGHEPNLKKQSDMVALGTIADMVPLTDDNRILAKTGLLELAGGARPGISALADVSGIQKGYPLGPDDVAFRLAPRINAAGRMDHASLAMDLLTAPDTKTAARSAEKLQELNMWRQTTEKRISAQIHAHIRNHPEILENKTIVLAQEDWDAGVIGIVAAKLVRDYYRPIILIALDEGTGKGSGRSIPGINLHDAIDNCNKYLGNYGGHAMAAGLEIQPADILPFTKCFEKTVAQISTPDLFVPRLKIDCELPLDDISPELLDELEKMHPFGVDNEEPLFMATNLTAAQTRIMKNAHRRMVFSQSRGRDRRRIGAIEFNFSKELPKNGLIPKIAYKLRRNRWNGQDRPELLIEEMDFSTLPIFFS